MVKWNADLVKSRLVGREQLNTVLAPTEGFEKYEIPVGRNSGVELVGDDLQLKLKMKGAEYDLSTDGFVKLARLVGISES